jgi:hypothetical protein
MDDKVQKAYDMANYMSTLANQKAVLKQEYSQNLVYFYQGHTFTVTRELINFTKTLIDLGHATDVALVDDNELPIIINDTAVFLDHLLNQYFMAVNAYQTKYHQLKQSRKIESLVQL